MRDALHIDAHELAGVAGDLRLVVDPAAMREAGQLAVQLVLDRTTAGRDRFGQAFRPYSTQRLAVPSGSTTTAARKRLEAAGAIEYFTSKRSGGLWMLVEGGYAALKAARYPQDGGAVNLRATGAMLDGLGIVAQDGDSVTIGFASVPESLKAGWNIASRDFMGLTSAETGEVAGVIEDGTRILGAGSGSGG